jgi:hypothetical protein
MFFFLAACSARTVAPSQTPPDPTAMPTVTAIPPTVTPLPTATPDVTSTPAFDPISAPTVVYAENAGVEAKCVAVSQEIQNTNLGNGVAVFGNSFGEPDYLLNMNTGVSINLGNQNERFFNGSVSPDGTLFFAEYMIFGDDGKFLKKYQSLLMTADGKIKKEFPPSDRMLLAVWQDNQHLIMFRSRPYYEPVAHQEYSVLVPGTMLYLNPFTGQQRILVLDFPDLYTPASSAWSWEEPWGKNPVVYSPTITRVVYLAEPGYTYRLWDTQKKKALIDWVNIDFNHHPRWSPDGSKFLMAVSDPSDHPGNYPNGMYLVDDNGNVLFQVPAFIADYFWSPSGRYVALKLLGSKASDGYYNDKLAILDTQTKKITDYCVEFRPYDDSLIWSPDETQILLNDSYRNDIYSQIHDRVILVDLAKGTAFPIAEDMVATGWMKAP